MRDHLLDDAAVLDADRGTATTAPPRDGMADVGQRPAGTGTTTDDRDVVIDLTGPTPVRRVVSPRRGRWSVLLAVVLLVGLVTTAALAYANYGTALAWRDRATQAEARADRAEADAVVARRRMTEARQARRAERRRRAALARQLAVSEADAAALEARVVALADDRARAEDAGATVGTVAPAAARSLQAQLDSCVAQIDAARAGIVVDADVDAWRRALRAAETACEQVAADLDALAPAGR